MIYLYKVTGKDIHIRHTNVMPDGRIHVAVIDDSFNERILMSLVLPEFILTSNKLNQYDSYIYLNFIIDKYPSIVNNLKDEKDLNKFFSRGDDFTYDNGLDSLEGYTKLIRSKANKIIKSYENIGVSPWKRFLNIFRNKDGGSNNKGLPL